MSTTTFSQHYGVELQTSTIGAISELRVTNDLLIKGYEVYRSVTPNSTYDLVATKGVHLFRIEVRTATYAKTGAIQHGRRAGERDSPKERYAFVLPDNRIVYEPPFETV